MNKKTLHRFFVKITAVTVMLTGVLSAQTPAVLATNTEASKPAAYIFRLTFAAEISPSAVVEITFPDAFNLGAVMMAVSDSLEGTLNATVDSSLLTLKRNGGATYAAGQPVDFKIASIINPSLPGQEWDFGVTLLEGRVEKDKQQFRSQIVQLQN